MNGHDIKTLVHGINATRHLVGRIYTSVGWQFETRENWRENETKGMYNYKSENKMLLHDAKPELQLGWLSPWGTLFSILLLHNLHSMKNIGMTSLKQKQVLFFACSWKCLSYVIFNQRPYKVFDLTQLDSEHFFFKMWCPTSLLDIWLSVRFMFGFLGPETNASKYTHYGKFIFLQVESGLFILQKHER